MTISSYPSVEVMGHRVHVFKEAGEWEIWLNTATADFDGLCIGCALSRQEAISQAARVLEGVTLFLLESR